ncbi:C40 family peptidase [Pseudogemmobacter sonorensis]|uniref:C40 family peptidase n=1 Tax=Pseudogemmobacter sonorensis TaxID=2989681 RepID=UPI0036A01128
MWSDRYVGIPYADLGRTRDGCDCYGLVRLVYAGELGITLPPYLGYGSVEEHAEIAALIEGARLSPFWQAVDAPAPFDIAVFRRGRLSTHLGIVIRPGLMLHMQDEDCAKIESWRGGVWGGRLTGHYRHIEGPAK